MKRRLFNLLTGLSLILCVATVGMWVRSYFVHDRLQLLRSQAGQTYWGRQSYIANSCAGGLSFVYIHEPDADDNGLRPLMEHEAPPRVTHETDDSLVYPDLAFNGVTHERFGFGCDAEYFGGSKFRGWQDRLVFPYWLLGTALSAPSLIYLRLAVWHHGWQKQGCCPVCGYDLQATPDRCPECGTVPQRLVAK